MGGLTNVAWEWSIPRGPDNKDLNQLLGISDTWTARVGLTTLIGLVFLLIVLVSPSGLIGLWERAVSFLSGPRRGPTDRTPVEVQTAEPSG